MGRIATIRRRVAWLVAYARGLRNWGRVAAEAAGTVDAWHVHDLTALAAIVPSMRSSVPVVYDSHELYLESPTAVALPGFARWMLRRYEKRLVSKVAALITVNDEIAAELNRRYRPRVTAVVHNCPPLGRAQTGTSRMREATGTSAETPLVLYHGALVGGRGIERLMDALTLDEMGDIHLALMGYGAMRESLRTLARSEPWRHRMHVLDPVPPSAIAEWVSGADIGVMVNPGHTLNDVYSSPNKLFECLAAGTPVVASSFPTFRRIIVDNPDGPLGAVCDPNDVNAIAASIRSILGLGDAEKHELRARCRRAAEERWSWEREERTLLSVYSDLRLRGQLSRIRHPGHEDA
jgi:glycosyltransferase involved in cell wall biosynthesis